MRLFAAIFAATMILAGASAPTPRDLLRTVAGFTDSEWAAVDRGDAVSKLIETDTREVAVAGAVRISDARPGRGPRFLHDLGQPRPHPLPERLPAAVRPFDRPEPQPRSHAAHPGVDENGD